jgi:hypothetical protein
MRTARILIAVGVSPVARARGGITSRGHRHRGALGPERTDPAARCGVDSPSRSHAGTHVDLLMWVRAEEAYGRSSGYATIAIPTA